MEDIFARTRLLLGDEGLARLAASRVAVFGVGGVGGFAVEALARSGVGALDLVDSDTVDSTNLNRQIIATLPAVGRPKVEVARELGIRTFLAPWAEIGPYAAQLGVQRKPEQRQPRR